MPHEVKTLLGVTLSLVLLADQAAADCQTELDQLEGRLHETVLPLAAHRDANTLLRAGHILARSQASAPCDALAAEIDRVLIEQERVGGPAAEEGVTPIVPVPLGPEAPLVDAAALQDMPVFGRTGERLGTIEAVGVDLGDGSVRYALITPGRMGTGIMPVPFDALTLAYHPDTLRAKVAARQARVGNDQLLRMRASEIIERGVLNTAGDEIGEVEDVVVVEGEPGPFVLIEVGGFLGIGEKQIAIALSEFELIDEQLVLEADVTTEDLEAAPEFDPEAGQPIDRSQVLLDAEALEGADAAEHASGEDERFSLEDTVMALDLNEEEFEGGLVVDNEAAWELDDEQRRTLTDFYAPRQALR